MKRRDFLSMLPMAGAGAVGLTSCGGLGGGYSPYPQQQAQIGPFMLGVDRLARDGFTVLRGKRVGLITNQTGLTRNGARSRQVLHQALQGGLTTLFSPEHGLEGRAVAGAHVYSSRDSLTGLPAHSLYGAHRKPTAEMLSNVDTVLFDLQDIGCRSYTYISTMALAMEACGEQGKEFIVLDRPNPLGGHRVQGPPIERRWKSFVGQVPVPYVHGLTVGELARMIVARGWISRSPRLMVVPMAGWQRSMTWRDTGLRWVPTSPKIPHSESPFYYATTGMLGGMNGVDIGIPTSRPFEYAGGRGINGSQLASDLNRMGMPGVRFSTYSGSKPGFAGVQIELNPRGQADLCQLGVTLCHEITRRTNGEPLRVTRGDTLELFHKVYGSDSLWSDLKRGVPPSQIAARWQSSLSSFQSSRQPFLLYS